MADQPGMLGGYQLETQVADNAWIGVRAGHRFLVRLVGAPVDGPALGRVPPMCTVRVVDGGPGYVVSELVEGPSLQSLVSGAGPRGGEELDRIAVRTLTALSAIHQAGLVHGSFGPASVLLTAEGAVVDGYGVARGGVPAYAAPEQVAADQFTAAGDLFAWAATMVYAATGRPPFGEGEAAGIFNRVLQGEPD
ncbi:MAG: serine/threonine protein kinase, partial [Nonomuraea sp.]|nr:serine/threonine protein kinase [Nonomuraea sp.]